MDTGCNRSNLAGIWLYAILAVIIVFPGALFGLPEFSPAVALLAGLAFALTLGCPCREFNKKSSKWLLQASVVGLGFGMNLLESLKSGADGMMFTIVSVIGVMVAGVMLSRWMGIDRKTGYLISSGTAICGGSAIAAVGPVVRADSHQMAVSLGVIFILNSIALFVFPPLGHWAGMSQEQFGTWAAIAIHDTSSVVGAGDVYGADALRVATLVKLTRALWIIPLALVTAVVFRDRSARITVPWFIFLFVLAMVANTYLDIPGQLTSVLTMLAKRGMVLTLFFIGCSLSLDAIRSVGLKPMLLAVLLWAAIAVASFFVVRSTIA